MRRRRLSGKRPATKTEYLSTSEIAQRYGRTVENIRQWIVRGVDGTRLTARMIGGRWMVKRRWLKAFIAALKRPDDQPEPPKVESETKKQQRFKAEQEAVKRRLGG